MELKYERNGMEFDSLISCIWFNHGMKSIFFAKFFLEILYFVIFFGKFFVYFF